MLMRTKERPCSLFSALKCSFCSYYGYYYYIYIFLRNIFGTFFFFEESRLEGSAKYVDMMSVEPVF